MFEKLVGSLFSGAIIGYLGQQVGLPIAFIMVICFVNGIAIGYSQSAAVKEALRDE